MARRVRFGFFFTRQRVREWARGVSHLVLLHDPTYVRVPPILPPFPFPPNIAIVLIFCERPWRPRALISSASRPRKRREHSTIRRRRRSIRSVATSPSSSSVIWADRRGCSTMPCPSSSTDIASCCAAMPERRSSRPSRMPTLGVLQEAAAGEVGCEVIMLATMAAIPS